MGRGCSGWRVGGEPKVGSSIHLTVKNSHFVFH